MIIICTREGINRVTRSITEVKDKNGEAFKIIWNC